MTDTAWPGELPEWPGGWQSTAPGWIPVREAAAVLGVSRQRIHHLIAAGRLHARRSGPRLMLVNLSTMTAGRPNRWPGGGRPRLSGAEQVPAGWMLPVQAAEKLGFSRQRVHQLIASGALKVRREGARRVIVEQATLEAYHRDHPRRRDARGVPRPDPQR